MALTSLEARVAGASSLMIVDVEKKIGAIILAALRWHDNDQGQPVPRLKR